jgi:hypothetical protein
LADYAGYGYYAASTEGADQAVLEGFPGVFIFGVGVSVGLGGRRWSGGGFLGFGLLLHRLGPLF